MEGVERERDAKYSDWKKKVEREREIEGRREWLSIVIKKEKKKRLGREIREKEKVIVKSRWKK